jgi:N-acetylmuramoyl-L-alanine amidase
LWIFHKAKRYNVRGKSMKKTPFIILAAVIIVCALVFMVKSWDVKTDGQAETKADEDMIADSTENLTEATEGYTTQAESEPATDSATEAAAEVSNRTQICVDDVSASRVSRSEISVSWSSQNDEYVTGYTVQKRSVSSGGERGEWEAVQTVSAGADSYTVEDYLESTDPVQFEYRVEGEVSDPEQYEAGEGNVVLASNIQICIDPGHYAGKNAVTGSESYGYAEGDFTLALALKLRDILKEKYGIDACMTRDTGSITLGGYTDLELDQAHLALRGEYAADSDLFVSIHTNANADNANGYETCSQPLEISKAMIFVNSVGLTSDETINACNSIGTNLTKTSYELGISFTDAFDTVTVGNVTPWTEDYNDGLNNIGTVLSRMDGGEDYYGVLRGAAAVGVPGIIVEHGMHTVPEVRKLAEDNLDEYWAEADAYGIAYGFGFCDSLSND